MGMTSSSSNSNPRLAVVIPLGDARGDALEHLRSWTERQTCPREQFQLVLATDGSDAAMERRVERLLGPRDRLLRCARGLHERGLCDRAAREADAELLLFTEHHCIGEPACVEETIRFFDERPEMAGAFLSCRHVPNAPLGDLEKRMLEEHEQRTLASDHWFKFPTDAFTIRRRAYLEAGGLDHRYGLFADAVLAARAHQLGMAIGPAVGACLTHLTSPSFAAHQGHIADFTWGECTYRAGHESAWCEAYFGHAPEWANRYGLRAEVERAAALAVARVLVGELTTGPSPKRWVRAGRWLAEVAPRLLPALLGPRPRLAAAWAVTRWTEFCTRWLSWSEATRWRRYQQSAARLIHLTRLSWVLDHPPRPQSVRPTPPCWPIGEIPEAQRVGFHGLERHSGKVFRWSEPVALLKLVLPPGHRRLAIQTQALRGASCEYVRGVFWDGRPARDIRLDEGRITCTVRVNSAAPRWLILVADPLLPWRYGIPDRRRLGVPIFSVETDPA